ncbi:hypothetical protein H0H81_012206, partial [Sphagnurus paluster]
AGALVLKSSSSPNLPLAGEGRDRHNGERPRLEGNNLAGGCSDEGPFHDDINSSSNVPHKLERSGVIVPAISHKSPTTDSEWRKTSRTREAQKAAEREARKITLRVMLEKIEAERAKVKAEK